jgi:hypothetical protein
LITEYIQSPSFMTKLILTTIFSISASFSIGQSNSSIDTAKNALGFLKNFYTVYITDIAIGNGPHSEDSLRRKYCTSKELNKIANRPGPESIKWEDYDPITKAQDCDTSTLKTLTITRNKKKPSLYTVFYSWTDYTKTTAKFIIHLTVVIEKGRFKIDDVW